MHHILEYADIFLLFAGLLAVCAAALVAASLGFDTRTAALGALAAAALLHGGLYVLLRRLQRTRLFTAPTLVRVGQQHRGA